MIKRNFQNIETNGVILRTVIEGKGPLVIMVHGWPQCWYLWRHMIDPVVAAGYRVVVPDMRGFGASSCPPEIDDYNIRKLAGDVAGIATALGEEDFIVIGHDWGCIVSWYTALLYPQRCKAVMGLSVPFWRLSDETVNPPGQDEAFWYMRYFQKPGVAEAELEANLERSLLNIHYSVSAEAGKMCFLNQLSFPKSAKLLDVFPAPTALPGFMTREDLDYYVEQYRKSGFRGNINWYRNIPTISAITPEVQKKNISQPAAFVAGTEDPVLLFDPDWRDKFVASFDDLRFVELIPDAGHWVQLEKPAQTETQILRFLQSVRDNPK